MVEIFSKRDGPRREDVQVKRLIERNRGVITKLADQLSNGRYSELRKPRPKPQAEGLIIHIGNSERPEPHPEPRVRVTANGRVVAVDIASGRQLKHIGDIRDRRGTKIFILATSANGFIAPLEDDVIRLLTDVDGVAIGPSYSKTELASDIGQRIDILPEM